MTTPTDLWFAWMRGWMAAAHSFAAAQHAALKELAPGPRRQPEATAAAATAAEAAAEALGTAAGNKPSPSRRSRGRPRHAPK